MLRKFQFLVILGLVAACNSSQYQSIRSGLFDTGQPALHAISDQRLHELMEQMNSLMLERFITEPERDREIIKDTRRIAETADNLGKSIDGIFARLPGLPLNTTEQTTFRALADKLRHQAFQLKEQAVNNRVGLLPDTLAQISATCTACHGLFRQLGKGGLRHGS